MHDFQYYTEDHPATCSTLFRVTAIHDGKKIAAQRYVALELLASSMPEEYIWKSLRYALQEEIDKYEAKKALNPEILELQNEYNHAVDSFDQLTKAVYQAKISEQLAKDSVLMKAYYDEKFKESLADPKKSLHEFGLAIDYNHTPPPTPTPPPPPVDTYKERAPSEFEGVELDESLWNNEGDLA